MGAEKDFDPKIGAQILHDIPLMKRISLRTIR